MGKNMANLDKDLEILAKSVLSGKKVTFFQGAGVSTSAGIPDFRSPDTGIYSNLARLNLPYPEAVFDIDYFRENPKAFYTLADELFPGRFMPTKFHFLQKLFQDKKLLHRIYTQNIDTLERLAGIEDKYIVEAHGSFATNHCVECRAQMETSILKEHMKNEKLDGIPTCTHCKGYVKPDIVFFGEALPIKFFDQWEKDMDEVEVAIVAGTSLTVFPFASLPSEVKHNTTRVLVNKDKVGDFNSNKRRKDIVALIEADKFAETLAEKLGMKKELDKLILHESKKYARQDGEVKESASKEATKVAKEVGEQEKGHTPSDKDSNQKPSNNEDEGIEQDILKLKI